MIKPTDKFIITFPEDEDGTPVTKYRFILTISKNRMEIEAKLQEALGTLDGIDGVQLGGRYTMEITIAKTFDADEVLVELEKRIEALMSDIITPKLTVVE